MGSLQHVSGVRKLTQAAAQRLYARWADAPLQDVVLLEAFEGAGMQGDPAAVADHLLEHTDLPIVWALREPGTSSNPRVTTLKYRSWAYFRALASSRYLVNNVTFPALFAKRADQIYLNTWHGTPVKKMGRDVDGPYSEIANTVDNLQVADILLSSCPYMTETMYSGAYGVSTDHVVELGTPRVDVQFRHEGAKDLVLYAPTWQQASYTQAADDIDDVVHRIVALDEAAPGQVLLRVHSKVAEKAAADPRLAPYLAPMDQSTNELLGRARMVITDYSSVAFDALATDSAVVFYTPEPYPRGVYLADDQLPGPRTSSLPALQDWVAHGPPLPPVPAATSRTRFCPHEDGHATQRVVDRLLSR